MQGFGQNFRRKQIALERPRRREALADKEAYARGTALHRYRRAEEIAILYLHTFLLSVAVISRCRVFV